MNELLRNVFRQEGVNPPEVILDTFKSNFSGAVSVEWFSKHTGYEAIFYQDNIEYIALFGSSGRLKKYKMYLAETLLPALMKSDLEKMGEIMNVVLINRQNTIAYEVIIRDNMLDRFLIKLDQLGKVVKRKKL